MPPSLPTTIDDAEALRQAGPAALALALGDSRARLLRLFAACEAVLPPGLAVPCEPTLNLPLWELGHIGWFEEYWLARNPQRLRGAQADPLVARAAPVLPNADALYDSSAVAHSRRWHLGLPDARRTRQVLEQVRDRTLALLESAGDSDDALYFFRLALCHEDMHREAWAYMAQHLALDVGAALDATAPAIAPIDGELALRGGHFTLGRAPRGFAFDNELQAHEVVLADFRIDRTPVTWQRFIPFIEAGGYDDARWWSDAGWAWRQRHSPGRPRYLSPPEGGVHQRAVFGHWQALDPAQPAVNLSLHEAEAWCRWAGRRLPSEAEWEIAALDRSEDFAWGQVWEWTASPFAPYPGFEPHPYRDYSQPWFDGRPVLRGASFATAPRMRHARYRNFFGAERNDIFAGFRSCAI